MRYLHRIIAVLFVVIASISVTYAVPAYRGWQTKTQPDGTTITVRQMGDEFFHYWETQDGMIAVEQEDGTFVVTGEDVPTHQQANQRRKASSMYASKPRRAIGGRNFAPRGLVILVQFDGTSFNASNDKTAHENMLNQAGYNYSGATGSAVDYFKAQSNNEYAPVFDVVGPVTLPNNVAYYGEQGYSSTTQSTENDLYIADFVIDAILAADELGCDFSKYDGDNDGKVDIVYLIYAGKGQADGGSTSTIWPHNWELESALYFGQTHGTSGYYVNVNSSGYITSENLPKLDGKTINNYACSAELNGAGTRSGIGTLCHEFSHVLGLPDYYVTSSSASNEGKNYTPGAWTLMDYGSYNNSGKTPPNYSAFDKYYMGWATPTFLAKNEALNGVLTTTYGDAYQIDGTNTGLKAYSNTNTIWYLENRQKNGWDAYLPGHGMCVWEVKYNSSNWTNNEPNNDVVGYTIVTANSLTKPYTPCVYSSSASSTSGTPFPGTGKVTSWTPATGCALTNITESGGNITFKYNGGVVCHSITTNGTGCTIEPSLTCVENGTGLTATITPTDATYDFTSITVKLGTSNLAYTLSADNKTLTINGSAITGDASNAITITVVWTKNRYSYAMLGENCTEELEGVVAKNAALNLTITPDAGYTLADAECWDVEMDGNTLTYGTDFTYNAGTNTFSIASVTGDLSILAYGKHAVTWHANGEIHATNFATDDKITLPTTDPADCIGGKKFVGWCSTSDYENASVAPTFAKTGDSYSTADYYAVYATATSGGATGWELVTDASSLRSGDVLVIASNTQGKTAGDISSQVMSEVETTFSSDLSSITTLGEGTIELTLGGSTGAWTLTSTNGALGATAVKKLAWRSGTQTWSISIDDGDATILNGTSSYGRFIHNVTSPRFTTYATSTSTSASMLLPQLYRKSGGVTYSDYTTTCVICALTSISLNTTGVKTSFTTDDTFNSTGLVVTANYSNCSSRTVTPTSISTPTMTTAGDKTITVNYTENEVTKTADYTITVVELHKHTVTWVACGETFKQETYVDGAALVLPSPEPGANTEGKAFYGWTTEEHYTGAEAPATITAGGEVTADATYYAIYH